MISGEQKRQSRSPLFFKALLLFCLLTATACRSTGGKPLPPNKGLAPQRVINTTYSSSLQPRASLQHHTPVYAIALSPSGRMIALGGKKNIHLIDTIQGRTLKNTPGSGDIVSLAFSSDESLLAAGGNQDVFIWEMQSSQALSKLKGHENYITALAFSPDGQRLATGSVGERSEIAIWNIKTKQQETRYTYETPYADSIQTLIFSPDGHHLAVAGRDRRIRIWAVDKSDTNAPPMQTLVLPRFNARVLAFSPAKTLLAVGSTEGAILLYDWRSGVRIKILHQHQGPIQTLVFKKDSRILLSAGSDPVLQHWHIQSGEIIKTENLNGPARLIQISQNATTLVAQGPTQTDIFSINPVQRHLPQITIHSPGSNEVAFESEIRLLGKVVDDQGLTEISIQINNIIWASNTGQATRDLKPVLRSPRTREVIIDEHIPLRAGENLLTITARNTKGYSQSHTLKIHYTPERGKVWAAIIGISQYQHVAGLKYADADAQAFYDYLVKDNQVPKNQVTLLLNEAASLQNLRDLLGVELPQKARKQDTVIIYYAGHGAPEPDRGSEDGDGLEKYLLPYDADPKRLYSTAFPMSEIARIFPRLAAERVVMLQDTCFSGTTGLKGRTIQTAMFRASLSDRFLNRLTRGKGRVIISASEANEVSLERDDFGHGVFTHFLLESLRHGDIDGDGFISTTEAFRYVSEKVPAATGQNQNPVKKGIESSEIILGKVRTGK